MLWKNIVDFGFQLLYNQFAWSYDIVSWSVSLGEWRKWQLASLSFLAGPNVLEIAHGPGHMLAEMHQRGHTVTALDLSAAMGRLAQARLKRLGLDREVQLLQCQIPELPFPAGSFDSVLSQFPTNFIFQADTLIALNDILKPGGRLIILPEGHLTGNGPMRRFIHWLFYITGQTVGNGQADPAQSQLEIFWGDVEKMMEACGFSVKLEEVELEKSVATVLVAEKSS